MPCYLPSVPQIREPAHSWLRAGSCPCALGVPTDPGPGRPEGPASPAGGPTSGEASSLAGWGFCGQRGCPARGLAHLRVGEVPGAIVILTAPSGEPGPEVHLDQLPVRAEADVAEDAGEGRRGQETALVWPGPQAPTGPLQASTHTWPVGPAVSLLPPLGSPKMDPVQGRAGRRPLGISVKRSHCHRLLSMARGWRCCGSSQVAPHGRGCGHSGVGSPARPQWPGWSWQNCFTG